MTCFYFIPTKHQLHINYTSTTYFRFTISPFISGSYSPFITDNYSLRIINNNYRLNVVRFSIVLRKGLRPKLLEKNLKQKLI